MDRDKIIGVVLIVAVVVGWVFYYQYKQKDVIEQQKISIEQKRVDSIAKAKELALSAIDSIRSAATSAIATPADTLHKIDISGYPACYFGKADTVTVENNKISLKFTTRGGYPFYAQLKDFKNYNKTPLVLFNGKGNKLSANLPIDNGKPTQDLFFTHTIEKDAKGNQKIVFSADLKDGKKAEMIYNLPVDDYMMSCNIQLTGMPAINPLTVNWQSSLLQTEKDLATERMSTQIYYKYKNGENDYFTLKPEEKTEKTEKTLQWLGLRKQYFSTVLIADEGFNKMETKYLYKQEDSVIAGMTNAVLQANVKANVTQSVALKWYFGPNDYKVLNSYSGMDLDLMVPLGYGMMAFVKYINKFILIPLFYFLCTFINNYAVIIMVMTLFIRLILSFFTYKSYLSSAKMRVMKPELDELRTKCGDDTQKFSVEQMKLYKSAGVNPLGGCLPMVIQLPILLSMYYMFPSFIEFRQKSFLWATDLSCYDSILDFHFNVPFYGDHISLFTLLMTATSLIIALYNKNMTPQDPNNPTLKYMPYVFPIILMGVFNKMAAALTFYYTFSNILSLAQQFVIQKYFIDEKAIHAKLQENKAKPVTQSKWAAKLEEMQKTQMANSKPQQRINKK